MGKKDEIGQLARALKKKLTAKEFELLLDLDGDYTTSDWLYKALAELKENKP